MAFTTTVCASSIDRARFSAQKNMPNAPAANNNDTKITLHSNSPVKIGASGARGGRCIMSGSGGSNASVNPSPTAVTMLIHKIWTGVRGSVKPIRIATMIVMASPAFVGKVQPITLVKLS